MHERMALTTALPEHRTSKIIRSREIPLIQSGASAMVEFPVYFMGAASSVGIAVSQSTNGFDSIPAKCPRLFGFLSAAGRFHVFQDTTFLRT